MAEAQDGLRLSRGLRLIANPAPGPRASELAPTPPCPASGLVSTAPAALDPAALDLALPAPAPLDPASDRAPDAAALYDWECRHVLHRVDQDLGFWHEWATRSGGPVLELACGTGRLTVPLAAAGVQIVGVDNDPTMLAGAKRRLVCHSRTQRNQRPGAGTPLYVVADMRRFALARRFSLVFVGYNSLQLLTAPGAMATCLRTARQHLAPGGLVGVEVTDFQYGGADGPGQSTAVPLADAEGIRLSGALVHDLAARTSYYRRHFEGGGWVFDNTVVVRSLDRPELEALFSQADLTPVNWWAEGTMVRALAQPSPR